MTPVFALQPLPKSIFLAGPTPRQATSANPCPAPTWRPHALAVLHELGFNGSVYVPESENWLPHNDYDGQVPWEWEALNLSTVVVFWVPRTLDDMPAFTTNVEFGNLAASGKVVLGFPEQASKMKYLAKLAERHGIPVFHTLRATLTEAVEATRRPFGSKGVL